ncbi:D-alpha,beta-D-heptose 7-phosphate 1-kinase /D-beta-D-heptose 1-phosphate adenylyltransferase [Tenacibaculum skagerrakense]|uniref:Bifunctional protein HldE n=1 Tax=Tenacibaculum skagerrakense TaxID=186571 RepID=A0A4R2P168_9FLAO|nr:D-glycero-beta-D-manno-heptose-7-phosphate kinase [Tenacibaculum skagerrakense]TCP28292.1 D-alpha,beta-D-heptose 7-phosphate 1-kinase /D-beta-D-heptose 1-phosphate adenylyltransferase [Tenacibaculum skagerrakense]
MKNILVIGDIIIDNYLIGSTHRISPEAPVPVVKINNDITNIGGAGNVVNNLLAFGANADILSVIGDDNSFQEIESLFEKNNISTEFLIVEKGRVLTKKTRILSSNQQIVRYDKEDVKEITSDTSDSVFERYKNIVKNYDIVILSDYNKGLFTKELTSKIIQFAAKKNIKVLVDPKGSDYSKYSGAYLLTPNKKEASSITNFDINHNTLEKGISQLKSDYNLTISVITLGKEGIAIFNDHLKIFPTKAKEVYDVTGAGDTVIAAIAYKLAENKTIDEAIEFANLAAGVVVGKIGVATASISEINALEHNVKNIENLKVTLAKLKQEHKKIVFTNGCFDILHLGHVKYLEQAKKMGDILVIGVNSDNSVKKLKGDNRPINSEYDRAYLLNSLKSVDYTIVFNEETPYELIKIIEPDVLVKGGDYKVQDIVGNDIAKSTVVIDYIKGKSTTSIINKIKQ